MDKVHKPAWDWGGKYHIYTQQPLIVLWLCIKLQTHHGVSTIILSESFHSLISLMKREADTQDKWCFHSKTGLIRQCFYTFSCWRTNSFEKRLKETQLRCIIPSYCRHMTIAPIYSLVQHTERTHQVRTWNLVSRESKLLLLFCGHQIWSQPMLSSMCNLLCLFVLCYFCSAEWTPLASSSSN